ncbi:MAG TPA: aconitase/3-isopropylmalate dehydratase large subunit family protein [Gammaproteobacteria bacterium]|nr:aconitase/3-isopropylmalate dehydratase large subunit family protein [Gammaproteobacteria bacterium]
MNMIEKILARASGKKELEPGDIVIADVDRMVLHDLSSNLVSKVFDEEMGGGTIFDPERIAFVFDHTFSPPSQADADVLTEARRFASKHGISHLFDSGSGSIHHVIIENGLWAPGDVIIGCDSHTTIYGALGAFSTGVGNNSMAALGYAHGKAWFRVPETIQVFLHGQAPEGVAPRDVAQYLESFLGEDGAVYQAIEYTGPFIEALSVEDRLLFPLMAIDVGAKAGFINPDEKTEAFARARSRKPGFEMLRNDPGVQYAASVEVDVSRLEPQVACPPTVGNVKPIAEAAGVEIQLAEIGGSTGGRLEDIRVLAERLQGRKVHRGVRLQVVPATRGIYLAALREGLLETIVEAGGVVFPPGAGSNQAVNMGAMSEHEAMISTQARNFPGRNGHPKARHYLGSAATVAASALTGRITDPREMP